MTRDDRCAPTTPETSAKCCYGTIDATVHPIPEVALAGSCREPMANGLVGVFVFHRLFQPFGMYRPAH